MHPNCIILSDTKFHYEQIIFSNAIFGFLVGPWRGELYFENFHR